MPIQERSRFRVGDDSCQNDCFEHDALLPRECVQRRTVPIVMSGLLRSVKARRSGEEGDAVISGYAEIKQKEKVAA